jgi:CO/xanthine dehydrogenase FAD-binding subunit
VKYSQVSVSSPKGLPEALRLLSKQGEGTRVISGGTDVSVYLKDGILRETHLLDISHLRGLNYVRDGGSFISIGSRVTFSGVLRSRLLRRWASLLCQASAEVGSLQIRNLATVAGNICNASPAADSLPPLYVQDASVVLQSLAGRRELALPDYILGPRMTARRADELLVEVRVRKMEAGSKYYFKKLGLRNSQAISVVSVAAAWKGRKARIAIGAVAPTVVRALTAEAFIKKFGLSLRGLDKVCVLVSEAASPISDLRGSAEYRLEALRALAYEGFYEQLGGGGPE